MNLKMVNIIRVLFIHYNLFLVQQKIVPSIFFAELAHNFLTIIISIR